MEIEYTEDKPLSPHPEGIANRPTIFSRAIIAMRISSTARQAQHVLLVLAIIVAGVACWFFYVNTAEHPQAPVPAVLTQSDADASSPQTP